MVGLKPDVFEELEVVVGAQDHLKAVFLDRVIQSYLKTLEEAGVLVTHSDKESTLRSVTALQLL